MLTYPKTIAIVSILAVSCASVPNTPEDSPDLFEPAAIRADFDELYTSLEAAHFDLFARTPRAEQERVLRELRASVSRPMSREQAQILFQRFVAAGKIAHARIDPPRAAWERYRTKGGTAVPLALRVEGERVLVLGAVGVEGVERGDAVVAIENEDTTAWLGRLRAHVSADNDLLAATLLEWQLPLLIWIEYGEIEGLWLEIDRHGQRHRAWVPALSREAYTRASESSPSHFELDANLREARMIEPGLAYLRPGPFYDNRPDATSPWDPSTFVAFVDEAFDSFLDAGATALIVDLRTNPGGDNSFSDPMVAWFATEPFRFMSAFRVKSSEAARRSNAQRLAQASADGDSVSVRYERAFASTPLGEVFDFPISLVQPRADRRFEGKVYILVDRHTYSNAVTVAALAQDYGFATILGEETADLASTYGAMETFSLPRTGIEVGFPKAHIVRPSGDVSARGVVPDIAIVTPSGAVQRDVVLARAVELVLGKAAGTRP